MNLDNVVKALEHLGLAVLVFALTLLAQAVATLAGSGDLGLWGPAIAAVVAAAVKALLDYLQPAARVAAALRGGPGGGDSLPGADKDDILPFAG